MLSLFLALIVFSHGELPGFSSSSSYWRHLNDLRHSWNPSAPPSKIVWRIYFDKAQELADNNDSLAAIGLLESALEHVRHLPDTEERRSKTVEMLVKHSKENDIEASHLLAFLKMQNFKNDNLHALDLLLPGSSAKSGSVSVEAKIREADFLVSEGDFTKSERLYRSALKDVTAQPRGHLMITVKLVDRLCRLYYRQGRFKEGEELVLKQLKKHESMFEHMDPTDPEKLEVAFLLSDLALVNCGMDKFYEAEALYEVALPVFAVHMKSNGPDYIVTLGALARVHKFMGKFALSEKEYRRALYQAERDPDISRTSRAVIMGNYADLLEKMGKGKRAQMLKEKSNRLLGKS